MTVVSTAAGTLIRPTIKAIDQMLSDISSRYMFLPGDEDKLLDARLALRSAPAASHGDGPGH